jgi:hypothetical protein
MGADRQGTKSYYLKPLHGHFPGKGLGMSGHRGGAKGGGERLTAGGGWAGTTRGLITTCPSREAPQAGMGWLLCPHHKHRMGDTASCIPHPQPNFLLGPDILGVWR